MKRRKKSSILFSATLATAGVVAGSLVAISNNSKAESFASMSLNDVVSSISGELHLPENDIAEVLDTKIIIAEVNDLSVLENDPFLVSYKKIYGNFYSITYNTARETGIGYKTLEREEAIESVTLNYTFEAKGFDKSAVLSAQRYDLGEAQAWGVSSMMLDRYADSLESSSNVVKIAVLDSGIRASHVLFSEEASQDRLDMTYARNYVDYENPTSDVTDDNGHGTMVAGVITESTPKNVKIMPIKILDSDGRCDFNSAFEGAAWAMDHGVKLMNMSIGATQSDIAETEQKYNVEIVKPLKNFFATLESDGAIIVGAAGNESLGTIDYPAAAPSIIAATSVNQDNTFSSQFSNHGQDADFAAPGNELLLPSYLDDTGIAVFLDNNGNEILPSGTSFSSPFVAAAIADILMEHPSWTKAQVMNELKLNAEDLGSAGWDEYYGYGSLSFHVNKYADLTIVGATPASTWGTSSDVTVKANSSNYTINKYALFEGDVTSVPEPSNWKSVTSAGKSISQVLNVTKNGIYTVWLKNSNNEIKRTTFNVNKVDKDAPVVEQALSASKVSDSSEKLTIKASDALSGLEKVEWYYKANAESNYHSATDTFSTSTGVQTIDHTFTGLNPGSYTAYAKIYDKAGNTVTSSNVSFTLEAPVDSVSISNLVIPNEWTKNNVTVTFTVASNESNITHKALVEGSSTTAPSNWTAVSSPAKTLNESITISENGSYTAWYKNASGETAYKVFSVNTIDKDDPTASNITVSNLSSSSAKLTVNAHDDTSGIASVTWKYKLASASEYSSQTTVTTSITLTSLSAGDYVAYAIVSDNAGNTAQSAEVNFTIEEGAVQSDTVSISSVNVPSTWSKGSVDVTVAVSSEISDITHRALVNGNSDTAPTSWTELSDQSKSLTDTVKITANGTYTVWYKNASGETARESFTISKIDNTAPVVDEALAPAEVGENSAKLSISVSDAASGIAKIEWYYKLVGAEAFEKVTDLYANAEIFFGLASGKTHTFSNLPAGDYVAYAVIYDNAGNTTTTDQITFTIQGTDDPVDEPIDGPVDTTNPKTEDNISVIAMIGGAIVAFGAFVATRIRRR